MTSNIFSIVSGLLAIISIGYSAYLHRKVSAFTTGRDAKSLESVMVEDRKSVEKVFEENKNLKSRLSILESKMTQAVRAVQLVRFNPFKDQGSNQSFATAFVDEKGDGIVMSSLYARERMSIFAKPINNFSSTFDLSVEEKESLEKTKKTQNDK